MSSRAIDLELEPNAHRAERLIVQTYTYRPAEVQYRTMAETVKLGIDTNALRALVQLTPDEARVLANQLLQVADVCDEHVAAAQAERDRAESFDAICDEMRDAGDQGTGVMYGHPDVHYVPAGQVAAKVAELEASGTPRYIVLPEPDAEPAIAP